MEMLNNQKASFLVLFFCFLFGSFAFAQPANNDCVNAIELTSDVDENECITINNTGSTWDHVWGACQDNGGTSGNIWFSFVANGYTADVTVNGVGTTMGRPGVSVLTTNEGGTNFCEGGTNVVVGCVQTGGTNNNTSLGVLTEPGNTYYISVNTANAVGNIEVCVENSAPIPGEGCGVDATICGDLFGGPFNFRPSTNGPIRGNEIASEAGCNTGLGGNHIYGWIMLYIEESGPLNMLINGNLTSGYLDVIGYIVPPGEDPCVAVRDQDNEILCNYAGANNGCVEIGNEFNCTNSQLTPAPIVNAGDQIIVIVQNYSNPGSSSFTIEFPDDDFSAKPGMPDATINLAGPFCNDAGNQVLTAVNSGGSWSGDGVVNAISGTFNPEIAGTGDHTITHTISLPGNCEDTDQITISVIDCLCDAESGVVNPLTNVCPETIFNSGVTGNNTNAGFETIFILADDAGNIMSNNSTGEFTAPTDCGTYLVYSYNYEIISDAEINPSGLISSIDCSSPANCCDLSVGVSFEVTAPVVTNSTPSNATVESCDFANQAAIDAAFTAWVTAQTTAINVGGGCDPQISNDAPAGGPAICDGGTTTVTWTITDVCIVTPIELTATYTLNVAPAVTNATPSNETVESCDFTNQAAVDAAFTAWVTAQTTAINVGGGCDPQISNDAPAGGPTICDGGTTTVTWTITDACIVTPIELTATYTLNIAPAVTNTTPSNETVESCDFTNQAAVDAAFTAWVTAQTTAINLGGGCDPQISNDAPVGGPTICDGGTTTVTWTITDACIVTPIELTATYTLNVAPAVTNTTPSNETVESCDFTNQAAVDAAFTAWVTAQTTAINVGGGCDPQISNDAPVGGPTICDGGVTSVTWTITDACIVTPIELTATYTLNIAPAVTNATPSNETVESCDFANQAAVDAAFTAWVTAQTTAINVGGGCDPQISNDAPVVGPTICDGGTTTVTWTITDACIVTPIELTADFILNASIAVVLTVPNNEVTASCMRQTDVDASFSTWLSGVNFSGGCNADLQILPETPSAPDACGGSLEVTWTVTSACEVDLVQTRTFTIPVAEVPVVEPLSAINVPCIDDVPVPDVSIVIGITDDCTEPPTVIFVEDISNGTSCVNQVITRTYRVTDDCLNAVDVSQTITIDAVSPTFTLAGTDPTECGFADGFITISGLTATTDYELTYNGGGTATITTDGAGEYSITGLSAGTYTGFAVGLTSCPACETTNGSSISLSDPNPPAVTAPADMDICEGTEITLTATNPDGATITWNNGVTDGVAFTPGVGTVTYTVTANLEGCINSDVVVVRVNPIVTALNCPGDLTAVCSITEQPAYADYTAFVAAGGSVTAAPGVVLDETTFTHTDVSDNNTCPEIVTRTYEITDECGVTVTCDQIIVVNDIIAPTASNPTQIIITALPLPNPDITVVTDASDNCTVNPLIEYVSDVSDNGACPETFTRTYRVTDDCGNFIEVEQLIILTDPFPPTASNPAPISVQCFNDVPTPDVTVVTDAADNSGVAIVTFLSDALTTEVCPQVLTRTYRVTDDCGNTTDVTQTITINDDILPTASNPAAITVACASDIPPPNPSVVTDAADNCGVQGVVHVGDVSDNNVCAGEQITRTYRVTDNCGNYIDVTQLITITAVTPTFTLSFTNPTSCQGTDGTITLSGLLPSTAYQLSYNNSAFSNITTTAQGTYVITGLTAGSYSNFIVNLASCPTCSGINNATQTLVDPNPPTVSAGNDLVVCEGGTVTLTASNPDAANITWSGGVVNNVVFPAPTVGVTTYTVTANLNNCISTDQVTVTVNPLPQINLVSNQSICNGGAVTLTAQGITGTTFSWTSNVTNNVQNGVAFSPTQTGDYTVTASLNGCTSSETIVVTVHANPVVDFISNATIACAPSSITFTNTTDLAGSNCQWTIGNNTTLNGCNSVSHTFTAGGCYDVSLQVTTANGCVGSTSYEDMVCLESPPTAAFSMSNSELFLSNTTVDFLNSSTNSSSYVWNFGDGTPFSDVTNPSHVFPFGEFDGDVSYTISLTAYSQNNICEDMTSQTIHIKEDLIFWVPNTFTPDDDAYNPIFLPIFTSGFDIYSYKLLIFNRWGEVMFESNDSKFGWDGTYGGEVVQDGVYLWKISFRTKYNDERIIKVGHVNLIR
jgi:gliding motility-associated-like protein